MALIIVSTIMGLFCIFGDLIPLYQSRQWLLFWGYSFMLSFAYLLTWLLVLGVELPSPAPPIKTLINYFS